MIAKLKKNEYGNYYYCSECMMRQKEIEPTCYFCGLLFSNYEEVIIQLYKELLEEEMGLI